MTGMLQQTIDSAYAPTMGNPEENKETFYSQLKGLLRNIPNTDKLLLIGYFNARIGRENDKQKDSHKTTWTYPCSRHWHMIDFIITRCRDKMDICSIWEIVSDSLRGANCGTDHQMLRSTVIFSIRGKHHQKGYMKPVQLNTSKLRNTSHAESLVQEIDNALAPSWEDNKTH